LCHLAMAFLQLNLHSGCTCSRLYTFFSWKKID
jgi:hypothetical protein